jgi:hypothetical protein
MVMTIGIRTITSKAPKGAFGYQPIKCHLSITFLDPHTSAGDDVVGMLFG